MTDYDDEQPTSWLELADEFAGLADGIDQEMRRRYFAREDPNLYQIGTSNGYRTAAERIRYLLPRLTSGPDPWDIPSLQIGDVEVRSAKSPSEVAEDLRRALGEYKHDDCATCGTKVEGNPDLVDIPPLDPRAFLFLSEQELADAKETPDPDPSTDADENPAPFKVDDRVRVLPGVETGKIVQGPISGPGRWGVLHDGDNHVRWWETEELEPEQDPVDLQFATAQAATDDRVPEWRDVSTLRAVLEATSEDGVTVGATVYARTVLFLLNEARHLPRRARDRLTEQEGGPPNERINEPTAAEGVRAAGSYQDQAFAGASQSTTSDDLPEPPTNVRAVWPDGYTVHATEVRRLRTLDGETGLRWEAVFGGDRLGRIRRGTFTGDAELRADGLAPDDRLTGVVEWSDQPDETEELEKPLRPWPGNITGITDIETLTELAEADPERFTRQIRSEAPLGYRLSPDVLEALSRGMRDGSTSR